MSEATIEGGSTATPSARQRFRIAVERAAGWFGSLATVRIFREDKLLLAGFLALWLSALWPMFVTPILPLVDMGVNIGAASLMNDVAFTKGVVHDHYFINPRIVPYWTVYTFMSLVEGAAGPFVAVKVTVGLALVLLPLGVMRLMRAFGRSPRLGLWAFVLAWDTNLYWGWITFQIGMALALWAIALVFETRSLRDALKVLPLTIIIALTHIHAIALTLVIGGLLSFIKRPFKKAFLNHAVALAGCALLIMPWLWGKLRPPLGQPKAGPLGFVTHPINVKLGNLFRYTVDLIPGEGAGITTYAFALLLLGPALFLLLAPRSIPQARRAASALFLLGAAGLYLLVPFEISGPIAHWWTYPRFGTYVLIGLLLLPRPRLDAWRGLAVLPGVFCAFFMHRAIQQQFKDYGAYVAPYMQIIAALPRNQLLFPMDLDDARFRGTHDAALGQLHGYAAAAKSCFDPHLFDEPNNPLRYRASNMPPIVDWYNPGSFSMEREGQAYDYVIVHPADRDPIARKSKWRAQVELVKEAGPWRLYKVKH
jgi:hypothetical protein